MAVEKIQVPDLGTDDTVEVIEVQVKAGDSVNENDTLVVLESDKAAMDIPAPKSGVVKQVLVQVGAQVKTGSPLVELETGTGAVAISPAEGAVKLEQIAEPKAEPKAETSTPAPAAPKAGPAAEPAVSATVQAIRIPDLGTDATVDVIDILVKPGDAVGKEGGLITLETDKAAMDVPAQVDGIVRAVKVKVGDKVKAGTHIADIETSTSSAAVSQVSAKASASSSSTTSSATTSAKDEVAVSISRNPEPERPVAHQVPASSNSADVYAGPAVRKLARELGVDLGKVVGTGMKGRIQKEDVHEYVKLRIKGAGTAAVSGGSGVPAIEDIDFSRFGPVEEVEMSKLHRVTAVNMTKNWLNVPHVTQFDEADVTDLEEFRAAQKALADKKGLKLSPLPFIIKACAQALIEHPQFNVSLHSSGTKLIRKKYINIGVAVATPAGLLVPVIRNADKKSIWDIARELAELAARAKDRKLTREEMEGACFTVTSLGTIGGTGFTPIVNAPEVAILGVSRAAVKPVYKDGQFVPRTILPFALSYDHRAVNGVDGGNFCTYVAQLLSDIRLMVL